MYISLEPNRAIYADSYVNECQIKIQKAHTENETTCELGASCFNATIIFSPYSRIPILQKTPAVGAKPAGRRSVKLVSPSDTNVIAYKVPNFGWSLYNSPKCNESKLVNIKHNNGDERSFWQWCSDFDLRRATEQSWIYYSDEDQEIIEDAFQSNESSVRINVGLTPIVIYFNTDSSVYHKQTRTSENGPRMRWVRRVFLSNLEKSNLVKKLEAEHKEDTCALCLNDFGDTPLAPTRKLSCGHVFHGVCIQMNIERGHNTCPLCRQLIS